MSRPDSTVDSPRPARESKLHLIRCSVGDFIMFWGRVLKLGSISAASAPYELSEAELRLIKTFHASPSLIAISTLEEGIHLDVNYMWLKTFGFESRDQVVGRKVTKLQIWHDMADRDQFIEILKRDGRVRHFESRFNGPEDRIIDVSVSAELMECEGRDCMVIIGHDITDRKIAERAMANAKIEAEEANYMKSQLLANVSHELRTPLNAIIGFSEMIRSQMFGELGHQNYLDYAEDIHVSGQHLLEIVNDLLDLSRADASMLELREQIFELPELVAHCVRMVGKQAADRGVSVDIQMPGDLPAIKGDRLRLSQILMNLLSNGIKFGHDGGSVTVRCEIEASDDLMLAVADDGIGMTAEELDVAFTIFGQAKPDSTRALEGTGLGLPLSRILAETHGGTLHLESEAGRGTTAILRLPEWRATALGD